MRSARSVRFLANATALVSVVGGAVAAATYTSLREGPLPVVIVTLVILLALVIWTVRRQGLGAPRVMGRLGSVLVLAALVVSLGFFLSTLALGSTKVPDWLITLGTFVVSCASLLALPLGLILVGVSALKEKRLRAWARPLPLVATLLFLAVPVAIALLPEGNAEGRAAALGLAASGAIWSAFTHGIALTIQPSA